MPGDRRKTHAAGFDCSGAGAGARFDPSPEMVTCRRCVDRLAQIRDPLTAHALMLWAGWGYSLAEIDAELVAPAGYALAAVRQAGADLRSMSLSR